MFLLDTNVLIFHATGDERLKPAVCTLIEERPASIFTSAISSWEIVVKQARGKLELDCDPVSEFERQGIACLPFDLGDAQAVRVLPHFHEDPFDRALIAQAKVRGLTVITADEVFRRYPVPSMVL